MCLLWPGIAHLLRYTSGKMVELRPITESDADELFPLISCPEVTNLLGWPGPASVEQFRTLLREREERMRSGSYYAFTIISKTAMPIGNITILPSKANFSGDMGLWIGSQFHGFGYGTEAVRLAVRLGFEELKLHRLEARVFSQNAASRRIFEKNGFTLEEIRREAVLIHGSLFDEWIFAVLNQNFSHSIDK